MANIAAGSRRQLLYVAEADWGVTPSGAGEPTMKVLRNTGGSGIQVVKNPQQSEEFRSDRAIAEVRMGVQRATLEIPFELSFATFDDLLEAALFGEWTLDVLDQGVVVHSFTFEEGFTDVDVYLPAVGAMVNTMTLNLAPEGAMVTGSFGLVCKAQRTSTATTMADSVVVANTNPVFDSFQGHILKGTANMAVATSATINLTNNVEQLFALFQDEAFGNAVGRCDVQGSIEAYFQSEAEMDEFLNEDEISLEFELEDLDENKYTIELPRVKWTGNTRNLTENTATQTIPFQALFDADLATTMRITRTEA